MPNTRRPSICLLQNASGSRDPTQIDTLTISSRHSLPPRPSKIRALSPARVTVAIAADHPEAHMVPVVLVEEVEVARQVGVEEPGEERALVAVGR